MTAAARTGGENAPSVVGGGADLDGVGGFEQMSLNLWRADGWLVSAESDSKSTVRKGGR
jgi:hypothetical protein